MTDVSNDREINGRGIQRASGGGPPHPAAAAAAGVLGNPAGFIGRTSGVTLQDRPGQRGYKVTVFLLALDRGAAPRLGAVAWQLRCASMGECLDRLRRCVALELAELTLDATFSARACACVHARAWFPLDGSTGLPAAAEGATPALCLTCRGILLAWSSP